jgi:hypothetical protein
MLPSFTSAVAIVAITFSFAYSDTFLATLTKVEGNKVTYKKATYNRDVGGAATSKYSYDEPVTVEAAQDAAITSGHFLPAEGRSTSEGYITGKTVPIEGGLGNDLFKNLPERKTPLRPSLITIADKGDEKGKITAINLWRSASPK